MTLQYICNTAGLYHDDNIRLDTTVEFNLMGPVFDSNKAIDYTTLFEPLASEFVAAGKGHIVASVGQASGEVPYTCFSATKSYIEKNSAVIEAFLRAIIKGYRFMLNSTIDEVAAALQPSFETTAYASVKATLQSYIAIDAWCSTPIMTETSFEKLQDIMSNAGTLSQRADFTKMVDNSYARNALDQLIG